MKVYKKDIGSLKIGDYLEISNQKVKILNIVQKKENLHEIETEDLKEEIINPLGEEELNENN